MSEQTPSGGGPTSDPALVCPWCSAALPSATEQRCPSCGAALLDQAASEVPGVTRVDVEAILKGRTPVQKPRGIIGWLSGEYEPAEAAAAPQPGTLEPPDEAVRREMLRLELAALEAEVAAAQAEAVAEVATETGAPVATLMAAAQGPEVPDTDLPPADTSAEAASDAAPEPAVAAASPEPADGSPVAPDADDAPPEAEPKG